MPPRSSGGEGPPSEASSGTPSPASDVAGLFDGYGRQLGEQSRRSDGLPLRLERLIDEISDFMGYAADHREGAKIRALSDPADWEKRLEAYYVKHVRPRRLDSAHTLEQARRSHPNQIVYLELRNGESVIRRFDRDDPQATDALLLDGAVVETMAASRTPFPAPRDLFGRRESLQRLEEGQIEAAFQEAPAAAPVRAPKP